VKELEKVIDLLLKKTRDGEIVWQLVSQRVGESLGGLSPTYARFFGYRERYRAYASTPAGDLAADLTVINPGMTGGVRAAFGHRVTLNVRNVKTGTEVEIPPRIPAGGGQDFDGKLRELCNAAQASVGEQLEEYKKDAEEIVKALEQG